MMFPFPYLRMPYYNRYSRYGYHYPYNTYSSYYNNRVNNAYKENKKDTTFNKNESSSRVNAKKRIEEIKQENCEKESTENRDDANDAPIFQLFGINLYFDDILIICLIWFLYSEGVKDEELFISLILLLLS